MDHQIYFLFSENFSRLDRCVILAQRLAQIGNGTAIECVARDTGRRGVG
jgi:hypothetical protein